MPEDVLPKPFEVLRDGRLSWKTPGIRPDLTSISIAEGTSVFGQCCLDLNMNGQCDPEDGVQGGNAPATLARWTLFGPGGLQTSALPRMPSGVAPFDTPRRYDWVQQSAIAPRFNYDEWIFNQYSPFFWKSWTLSFYAFIAREETD